MIWRNFLYWILRKFPKHRRAVCHNTRSAVLLTLILTHIEERVCQNLISTHPHLLFFSEVKLKTYSTPLDSLLKI